MRRAHKLLQLPCLVPMTDNAPIVKQACKAVLDKFRSAPYSIPAQTGKVVVLCLHAVAYISMALLNQVGGPASQPKVMHTQKHG